MSQKQTHTKHIRFILKNIHRMYTYDSHTFVLKKYFMLYNGILAYIYFEVNKINLWTNLRLALQRFKFLDKLSLV